MRETDCYWGDDPGRYRRDRMLTWLRWIAEGCPPRAYWRPPDYRGPRGD